jgi:RelA/SpoT family (p)ppGpp synthetase
VVAIGLQLPLVGGFSKLSVPTNSPARAFCSVRRQFSTSRLNDSPSSSPSEPNHYHNFMKKAHELFVSASGGKDSGANNSQVCFETPTYQTNVQRGNMTSNGVNGASPPDPRKFPRSVSVNGARQETTPVIQKASVVLPTAPEVSHWTDFMSQDQGMSWFDGSASRPNNSPVLANSTGALQQQEGQASSYWEREFSVYDVQQIDQYWDRLLPAVNYLGTEQVAKIYKALCVAYRAHRGQMRKSGEPFIIHPVEVAMLLSSLRMDGETVIAGLLHDTVEDTDLTFDQIESLFGHTVRSIVEGETKVSKLPKLAFTDYADEQAENLRQMFVAMTDDYRIIIVKLADRLHNMRTLRHMKPEKQIKISRETLDIFAPLAHRMGVWKFKAELEDTAFMYLYPLEYKRLNRRLREHQTKFRVTLDKSQAILQQQLNNDPTLQQQAAKVEVFGRTKEIYSLWHKMETKQEQSLDSIVDVVALRVIITPKYDAKKEDENKSDRGVWLCYHVLGLVQHLPGFQPVPTRVKDYISFPKPNGYQSLHTALNLNGQTIEVQIRTSFMHQVAEYGMASHWLYTDSKRRNRGNLYNTPWLSSIKEWQNDRISSRDFVDSVRRELLGKRVFVFLRNGKILNLARGATAIDAAFQIHTEVGLKMHGVQINGKPVPFSYELQNGDVVSILTGDGRPSTDWMRFAKSRSTRSKLRSYFRSQQMESLREAGRIILMDYLSTHAALIERNSFLDHRFHVPKTVAELVKFLPGKSRFREVDDLLIAIGKHHDRSVLHKTVAQLFAVPKKLLVTAEEKKQGLVPSNVVAQVHERMRHAKDVAKALDSMDDDDVSPNSGLDRKVVEDADESLLSHHKHHGAIEDPDDVEYADPEHLCEHCLPVYGDQIIGTRPRDNDSVTTVHRMGCPHAQRAIVQAAGERKQKSITASIQGSAVPSKPQTVDSVSLRNGRIWKLPQSKFTTSTLDVPVPLVWSDLDDAGTEFLTEVVVLAEDRKLLLADCSEVVSEAAEIVKTGSSSNDDHATLVFLVNVSGLEQLQDLMDRLSRIRSVMSVERGFGSELL